MRLQKITIIAFAIGIGILTSCLRVKEIPFVDNTADFSADKTEVRIGENITFTQRASEVAAKFDWYIRSAIGDSLIGQGSPIMYAFNQVGNYNIVLKTQRADGKSPRESSMTISVLPKVDSLRITPGFPIGETGLDDYGYSLTTATSGGVEQIFMMFRQRLDSVQVLSINPTNLTYNTSHYFQVGSVKEQPNNRAETVPQTIWYDKFENALVIGGYFKYSNDLLIPDRDGFITKLDATTRQKSWNNKVGNFSIYGDGDLIGISRYISDYLVVFNNIRHGNRYITLLRYPVANPIGDFVNPIDQDSAGAGLAGTSFFRVNEEKSQFIFLAGSDANNRPVLFAIKPGEQSRNANMAEINGNTTFDIFKAHNLPYTEGKLVKIIPTSNTANNFYVIGEMKTSENKSVGFIGKYSYSYSVDEANNRVTANVTVSWFDTLRLSSDTFADIAENKNDNSVVVIGTNYSISNGADILLVKYNSNGTKPFQPKLFGTRKYEAGKSVQFNANNQVLVLADVEESNHINTDVLFMRLNSNLE